MLGDSRRGIGVCRRAHVALRGHGENRNGGGVGGRKMFSTAGTVIDGSDGGRYTSDESPRRSREPVNPHTWPRSTRIRTQPPHKPYTTHDAPRHTQKSDVRYECKVYYSGEQENISGGAVLKSISSSAAAAARNAV